MYRKVLKINKIININVDVKVLTDTLYVIFYKPTDICFVQADEKIYVTVLPIAVLIGVSS